MDPDLRTIAALAAVCARTRDVQADNCTGLVEDLLSRLRSDAPGVAQIVASVLRSLGNETGRELGEQLAGQLGHYDGGTLLPTTRREVDVVILAVKPVELTACLAAFEVPEDSMPSTLGTSGLCAWFADRDGLRYAIAMVGTAGNVESALVLGGLRETLSTSCAVLVGMAAGVRGDVNLGDVVVAEQVVAYEFARMVEGGAIYQPRFYNVQERRIRNATQIHRVRPNWSEGVRVGASHLSTLDLWPEDEEERLDSWLPHVHRAAILAGGRLIEDGSLPAFARDIHGRARAAEMEGAGFAAACDEASWPWFVVRGIADYGEPRRRKHWQLPATYGAAKYVRDALASGLLIA
jgi:adenosylhomocysteine nucleosidase